MGSEAIGPGEEMLILSERDLERAAVLRQVRDGVIAPWQGAQRLGLSVRHFRRLRRNWERDGDRAVIHGLRGQPSNRAKPAELRAWALKQAQEAVYHDFGPTLLAEHLSAHPDAPAPLKACTLRRWMIEAGLWSAKARRVRHRKARPRRAAFGELIQWDSSEHEWLEDRLPGRFVLIQMHDDATNRLLMARFVPRDTGAANRQILLDYLQRWGRPVAFYTDKAGHFGQWTRPRNRTIPLEERDPKRTTSIIRRTLQALDIDLIQAHSPQAKGRIERNFSTSQDRLIKELRVRAIATLEEANRFLEEVYLDYWNERFAVEPPQAHDAHRSLPKTAHLEALLAETTTRSVGNNFTIRYKNRRWQISKRQARGIRPRSKVTVELRLDGSVHFRFQTRYLQLEPVADHLGQHPHTTTTPSPNAKPSKPSTPKPKPKPSPPKPGPDHPWRKHGRLIANPRALARYHAAQAAQQPAPSEP